MNIEYQTPPPPYRPSIIAKSVWTFDLFTNDIFTSDILGRFQAIIECVKSNPHLRGANQRKPLLMS